MILIQNDQNVAIETELLQKKIEKILHALGYDDFDISVVLVSPPVMHSYNKSYRNKDAVTDILSFPFHQINAGEKIVPKHDDEKNLGDIIICPAYVLEDLARWESSFAHRMDVLLVHGICHLLGYDHIQDADYEIMKKQEERLLELLKEGKTLND